MGKSIEEHPWKDSEAKQHLEDLIRNNKIPATAKPKQVYETHCQHRSEFKDFGNKNFAGRLRALREKLTKKNDRAARDARALAQDRLVYPRPHQDGFGLPLWPTSHARTLLGLDMDHEKHLSMTREELWASRPEHFEDFPFAIFVKHIHQEVKTRKFHTYCRDKAEQKLTKKQLENIPSNCK